MNKLDNIFSSYLSSGSASRDKEAMLMKEIEDSFKHKQQQRKSQLEEEPLPAKSLQEKKAQSTFNRFTEKLKNEEIYSSLDQ